MKFLQALTCNYKPKKKERRRPCATGSSAGEGNFTTPDRAVATASFLHCHRSLGLTETPIQHLCNRSSIKHRNGGSSSTRKCKVDMVLSEKEMTEGTGDAIGLKGVEMK